MNNFYVHSSSIIDKNVKIGKGTKIWHFCHISNGSIIGENCNIGQNVYIGENVIIGNNVKIQNNVSIYEGITIEDNVFLGPSCVFTNIKNPRSEIDRHNSYQKTLVKKGTTIGANATILCGIKLGYYCFIGAGAVVITNVEDYALMIGVPAVRAGWMSQHGCKLEFKLLNNTDETIKILAICPESKDKYTYEKNGEIYRIED
jgi:UDP-2-acetamido-3-amino-2,3-dideoxy-glucuronate N-acetyltransferase